MKIILTTISCWIGIGLIGSGFTNSYFQNKYHACGQAEELGFALVIAMWGPFAPPVTFLMSGFGQHGWSLKLNACK